MGRTSTNIALRGLAYSNSQNPLASGLPTFRWSLVLSLAANYDTGTKLLVVSIILYPSACRRMRVNVIGVDGSRLLFAASLAPS